jgi:alpha-mannosidase
LSAQQARKVYVVPNFHPASCGWLTDFSRERVYCANSYFDHLDRVRDDPNYAFVLSECNNLIAMMNFRPDRTAELRRRVREGRVELVNAFFLESTASLSGGEALVRLGVEGIRWQQRMFGVLPRFGWTIDLCGTHEQMAQICAGLGLGAMVYTRLNPTGSAVHWAESPDGSRILALAPGPYAEFRPFFNAKQPLGPKELRELDSLIAAKQKMTPAGAPTLILGGSGDYSLPPAVRSYPREFLGQWRAFRPEIEVRFATMSQYLEAILPAVRSGEMKIPTMRGTGYDHLSFWFENPRTKTWFRRNEHALYSAEALSTIASLAGKARYPARELYQCWVQMFLNMDRNTLWGAAGGMVFEHDHSWDARDRYEYVDKRTAEVQTNAARTLLSNGNRIGLCNTLAWHRDDPVRVNLPEGATLEGVRCQAMPDGSTLCRLEIPAAGAVSFEKTGTPAPGLAPVGLPEAIETRHYIARVDAVTGELASLRLKPSGREMLAGGANAISFERPIKKTNYPGDLGWPRPERTTLARSSQSPVRIRVAEGPLSTMVSVEGAFGGAGACRRVLHFYRDYPRVDFETELNDVPDRLVVAVDFPLKDRILEIRRGIPYGFSHNLPDSPRVKAEAWQTSIEPAIRWSHYTVSEGGVALFDRGLPGRECVGHTAILYLLNTTETYRGYDNPWLSGKGRHKFEYALFAHEGPWRGARVPQRAFEYNVPPVLLDGVASVANRSYLATSSNVIVEGFRRDEGYLELRLMECFGEPGTAEVRLHLPHRQALLTDLLGGNARPLTGGPRYRFPVRPQQIVTLRCRTKTVARKVEPLTCWDELVPSHKRARLNEYTNDRGHPPHGR